MSKHNDTTRWWLFGSVALTIGLLTTLASASDIEPVQLQAEASEIDAAEAKALASKVRAAIRAAAASQTPVGSVKLMLQHRPAQVVATPAQPPDDVTEADRASAKRDVPAAKQQTKRWRHATKRAAKAAKTSGADLSRSLLDDAARLSQKQPCSDCAGEGKMVGKQRRERTATRAGKNKRLKGKARLHAMPRAKKGGDGAGGHHGAGQYGPGAGQAGPGAGPGAGPSSGTGRGPGSGSATPKRR